MALRATVYKAELNIADTDRGYYGSHAVTVAKHPSETEERLMVRLLAYALQVDGDDQLAFTRGLSETDEPALWRKDLTGAISQWIEVGLPDDRRLLKACGRADEVLVFAYGRNAAGWWKGVQAAVARTHNLKVYLLAVEDTQALAALAERSMALHVNVQEGSVWVSSEKGVASLDVAGVA